MLIYEAVLVCERPLHPPRADEISIAGLLATNKQICNEALELFYKHNTFHFTRYDDQHPAQNSIQRLKVTKDEPTTTNRFPKYRDDQHDRSRDLTILELNWPADSSEDTWLISLFSGPCWNVAPWQHHGWHSEELYAQILNKPGGAITWRHGRSKQRIRLRNDSEDHLSKRDISTLFDTLVDFLEGKAS